MSGSSPDKSNKSSRDTEIYNRVVTITNNLKKNDRSWLATSQIPTDLSIQVDDITFSIHKYPLVSKCGYISRLELKPSDSASGFFLKLENFPGGAETFEAILKFCYGLTPEFNPNNIAALRCASEFLDMTEEYEDGNLISKTDAFITFVILASWKDTLTVLKSCERLSPWAENLQIIRRCCDLLAWKASKDDVEEDNNERCLYEDIATLRVDHFTRVITAIKARQANPKIIGKFIMEYADNWLPVIDEDSEGLQGYGFDNNELQFSFLKQGTEEENSLGYKERKAIVESLISVIPSQSGAVPCRFLLRMLKTAIIYSASPALISDIEKQVGMTLEDATVNDLLIPNFINNYEEKTASSREIYILHNVDVVRRIFEYSLMHEQKQQQQHLIGNPNITKLLDNYIAEIAKDPNLPITKFHVLAEALPENARKCHDGLYRAIDTYLKTHPSLSEHERKRLCKSMNSEKLSLDACMHAAQNERLPLRTIVQVLFSEQVKMRMAMQQGKEPEIRRENSERGESHSSRETEIKDLRAELETVKNKMAELQNDYIELQQEYEKLGSKQKGTPTWFLRLQKMKKSIQLNNETREGQQRRRSSTGRRTSFRQILSLS